MKNKRIILLILLLLCPMLVYASDGDTSFPVGVAIGMEAFVSIHMSIFVLLPLSNIFDPDKSKKLFLKLFIGRVIFLLIFDFFITPGIAIVDFLAVFVGAFLVVPITSAIKKVPAYRKTSKVVNNTTSSSVAQQKGNVILKCTKCGNVLSVNDQTCSKCGTPFSDNNVQVIQDTSPVVEFDQKYLQTEKNILKALIIEELKAQGENEKSFTTNSLNIKKTILVAILGIATLIFSIMYYVNYSLMICLGLELVSLFIYYLISKRFNVLNVLIKQAIQTPNEDVSNIIKKTKEQKCNLIISSKLKFAIVFAIAIIIPAIYFFSPRILYTKYADGYSVLRYTKGVINDNNIINIPETYKGKKVLSIGESAFENSDVEQITLPYGLESIKTKAFYNTKNLTEIDIPSTVVEIRGSAFENCTNLTTVKLHNGLKEIRGSAFKNNINLVNIELPDTLEYLGASAFSYCSSLTEITIPKKVIEINGQTFEYCTSLRTVNMHDDIISIHGEVFVGDSSLNNITLPSKITEIRGNTFEGCSSLTSIVIPEGVTRIGGHAFHGCSSLSYVSIPSTVLEIGSSAFRQCYSLNSVKVPYNAIINERAFKESPTSIQRY